MVPDRDIDVTYIGLKSREKLTDILSYEKEKLEHIAHQKLLRAMNSNVDRIDLEEVAAFIKTARSMKPDDFKRNIQKFVTDFHFS